MCEREEITREGETESREREMVRDVCVNEKQIRMTCGRLSRMTFGRKCNFFMPLTILKEIQVWAFVSV